MVAKLRIAALQGPRGTYEGQVTKEKNLEWTVDRVRSLNEYGPDIICLAEVFATNGVTTPVADHAEPVPGPITETMMKLAREYGTAIICPLIEKRGDEYYNTAVVIDENGDILGQYDKIHPTEGEVEEGKVPGRTEPTVIELCGVKTGYQICYDANWPGDWLNLKQAGAQVIFFCSAFSAGTLLDGYATTLRIPIVASTLCPHCRIIDRMGQLLAHQSPYFDYATADVLFDQPLFHLDGQWEKVQAVRKEHKQVTVFVLNGNGTFTMPDNHDPEFIQSLVEKYDLLDVDDYMRRAEAVQDRARK